MVLFDQTANQADWRGLAKGALVGMGIGGMPMESFMDFPCVTEGHPPHPHNNAGLSHLLGLICL